MSTNQENIKKLAKELEASEELIALAMQQANNEINLAKLLIQKWIGKPKSSNKEYKLITDAVSKEFDGIGVIVSKTSSKEAHESKEYRDACKNVAEEVSKYGYMEMLKPYFDSIENKFNCNIYFKDFRFEKSSHLSMLTSYRHKDKFLTVVEFRVDNEEALKSKELKRFGLDMAMHVGAFRPSGLTSSSISESDRKKFITEIENELYNTNKSMSLWQTIIEGKLKKWEDQRSLFSQVFIKDNKLTIAECIEQLSSKIKSNIAIKQFYICE